MATRNLVPRGDNDGGQLGTSSKRWSFAYLVGLVLNGVSIQLFNFRNSADLTTTNTTATDATGFGFSIAANEVWSFEIYCKIGSSSAAGTKYAINMPSGATIMAQVFGSLASATAFDVDTITAATTLGRVFNTGALTTAAEGAFVKIQGVVANGATPGTVQFQHGKVTSGTSTIYANSYMIARRIS